MVLLNKGALPTTERLVIRERGFVVIVSIPEGKALLFGVTPAERGREGEGGRGREREGEGGRGREREGEGGRGRERGREGEREGGEWDLEGLSK